MRMKVQGRRIRFESGHVPDVGHHTTELELVGRNGSESGKT